VDKAKAVKVVDAHTYTAAGTLWKQIGDMIKEVKDTFDPICEAANRAHKEATSKRAKYLDPLAGVQKAVKNLMSTYDTEQEKLRLLEQIRLEEIARKEVEERQRVELARLEEERKAEETRLLEAAAAAEKAGDKAQAEELATAAVQITEEANQEVAAIAAEPVYVAPVVLPKATPKLAGGPVYRETWSAEITDIKALCRAVGAGTASTEFVQGNMPALNKMAIAMKSTMNVPGVRAISKRV
jgi:hypothetical protein